MKTKILYLLIALLTITSVTAQKRDQLAVPETLPGNLELKDEIQTYKVTTIHYNGDMFGRFFNKQKVYGEYTRGLKGGMVKWNNVSFAQSNSMDRNAEFPEGTPIAYMENFTYLPNEEMIKPEKFETFTEYADFTRNLVWDMLGIEGFAWAYWDKLKLNKPYLAKEGNGKVDLAGQGYFENKDIQITYIGISVYNGEPCAIIGYRTMNNPLEVRSESVDLKGRSHYWGNIWVSLEDKQIEHATLLEDVMMELCLPGQTQKQIMNATREITYEKVL